MSIKMDAPTSSVPNAPTKHGKNKIFQSTYNLEKQFLPRQDETLERAFMRKIQEISYESSRFRGVLTFMGIEISQNEIVKFYKMTKKSFKHAAQKVASHELISKVQAAVGRFHL